MFTQRTLVLPQMLVHVPILLLLLLLGFVGQATALKCYRGRDNTTKTMQCKKPKELCVTLNRYTVDGRVLNTKKGCLAPHTYKLCDNESNHDEQNIKRCYTFCAENFCNGETKPTPSQHASVTINSMPVTSSPLQSNNNTTTRTATTATTATATTAATTVATNRIGNNAEIMRTSGMYLFCLILCPILMELL